MIEAQASDQPKLSRHVSVLAREVIESLGASEGGNFLDCTLGGAGHTEAILRANESNTVVALDRDARAIERAKSRLSEFGVRVKIKHAAFGDAVSAAEGARFRGAIADLGLSTDQLFEARGFSFQDEESLDMRMDESSGVTAADILNSAAEGELYRILRRGGVGPEARSIAAAVVRNRPVKSASQLAGIINALPFAKRSQKRVNPATVVFQALRIEVNSEFDEIQKLLESAPRLIEAGGRLAIITFHSLEDKLVTAEMRKWEGASGMPALWPGRQETKIFGKLLTKKPITPSEDEVKSNPSARSARLRVFEFSGEA